MYEDIKSFFFFFNNSKSIGIIIIFCLVVYFLGLFNGFVGDDYPLLVDNQYVQSIQNIPGFFTGNEFDGSTGILGNSLYRPIQNIIYSVLHEFVALNSYVYHLLIIAVSYTHLTLPTIYSV